MTRDLTKAQYVRQLEKFGFNETGGFGYVKMPKPYDHISVCSLNGGNRYRARIAYLLNRLRQLEEQQ